MLDSLGSLTGAVAYLAVGVLAALEASAFVGLFVPGELALLTGGYIAQQGRASLVPMMLVAAVGAIVGDSIGYEIGRQLGPRLQRSRLGRKVGEERWQRAEAYLEEKGGRAIFAGRFIGVLRALVPALAGATKMPYRRFLVWNAAGAIIWAPGMVLAGYLAGSSYKRVEKYSGRAGLLLLGVAVVVGLLVFAAHWIAHHPDRVRNVTGRVLDHPRVAAVTKRYHSQLAFLTNRFRPGNVLGLALTSQLAFLAVTGWAFGKVLQDVLGGDATTSIDLPAIRYIVSHRTPWLTHVMEAVTWVGNAAVLFPLVLVLGLLIYRRSRSWTGLAELSLSLAGAMALYYLIKPLVGRPRPHIGVVVSSASGYAFPSGHATQVTAVMVTLAILGSSLTPAWTWKVTLWALATAMSLVVGFSRVYLGVHWPTDVFGGHALGALWAALLALVVRRPLRAARSAAAVDVDEESATPPRQPA